MVKHSKLITVLAILLLVIVSVTGCDSYASSPTTSTATSPPTLLPTPAPTLAPTPTPTPAPTPAPLPTVRVTIRLTYVICNTKQDALGFHDHFYMVTAFAANGSSAQSQLLPKVDMDSGQAVGISQNSLVFNGLVARQGSIEGGFIAYNDTQGLAWGNIMVWVAALVKTVADKSVGLAIDTGNGLVTSAAGLLDLAANAWYATANVNNTDTTELGRQELSVSASGPPSEDGTVTFHNDGGWFGSGGWDYTVGYQITRTPA